MGEAQKLTALKVKNLKDVGMYSDGDGLNLKVSKTGSKSWVFRYMIAGKATMTGLGAYPEVSLAEARERAAENRKKIRSGINPVQERRENAATVKAEQSKDVMTFNKCAAAYIKAFEPSWKNEKHADQWRNTLATYAAPTIGALDVARIETDHILKVLEPIWYEKAETAARLRARIETVLDWATVKKYRTGNNPATWKGNIQHLLPARDKAATLQHHPALPHAQMPEFMKLLQKQEGIAARAVEFAILTAARSGEVRLAVWGEIDTEAKTWTVPASRMKAKRPHTVLLSDRALSILAAMKKIASGDLIFPGVKQGRPLSDMTLTAVLRRMHETSVKDGGAGWTDPTCGRVITTHGTARSTFYDWVADLSNFPTEMADLALAHAVSDKVKAAYMRTTMIDRRRGMMQDWSDFCYPPKKDQK